MYYPFRKWDAETRQKESCPFHDLRAEGQFQPDIHKTDDPYLNPNPRFLLRKDGGRLNCSQSNRREWGCGGEPLRFDTVPQPPQERSRTDKPWTTNAKGGLFSRLPYEPLGPCGRELPNGSGKHFRAGKGCDKFSSFRHMSDGGEQSRDRGNPFRMNCGKGGSVFDPHIYKGARITNLPLEKRTDKTVAKMRTNLRANIQNTFGRYPVHMPMEPLRETTGKVEKKLKPIYTWSAKSKRTMPIRFVIIFTLVCLSK